MRPTILFALIALAATADDFHSRRAALREAYIRAETAEEKQRILAEYRRLDLDPAPAAAETAPADAADAGDAAARPSTIEEIEGQIEFLEWLRDFQATVDAVRDHVRPTDDLEALLAQPGVGDELRALAGLLQAGDAAGPEALPRWLADLDRKVDGVRQVSAAVDAATRIAAAIEGRETDSGGRQIEDLGHLFRDLEALLPAIGYLVEGFQVNPVLGAYFTVLARAIENIAADLERIEASVAVRNDHIREAGRALGSAGSDRGVDDERFEQSAAIDEAIEGLEATLGGLLEARRLRRSREDGIASREVDAAVRIALRGTGLSEGDLWQLEEDLYLAGQGVEAHGLRLSELAGQAYILAAEIRELEGEVREVEVARERRHAVLTNDTIRRGVDYDLDAARARLAGQRERLQVLRQEDLPRAAAALRGSFAEHDALRDRVRPIRNAIHRTLRDATHADADYLRTWHPAYGRRDYPSLADRGLAERTLALVEREMAPSR